MSSCTACAAGTAIVQLIALPFGGIGLITSVWLGLLVVALVTGGLFFFGRRRQNAAKAKRSAQLRS